MAMDFSGFKCEKCGKTLEDLLQESPIATIANKLCGNCAPKPPPEVTCPLCLGNGTVAKEIAENRFFTRE